MSFMFGCFEFCICGREEKKKYAFLETSEYDFSEKKTQQLLETTENIRRREERIVEWRQQRGTTGGRPALSLLTQEPPEAPQQQQQQQQQQDRNRQLEHHQRRSQTRNRRPAVHTSSIDREASFGKKLPVFRKTAKQRQFLLQSLSNHFMFDHLTKKERSILIDAFEPYWYKPNDVIIQQGDPKADYFFVVETGIVLFVKEEKEDVDWSERGQKQLVECKDEAVVQQNLGDDKNKVIVGSCGPGESFGEISLLYDSPRAVSCIAGVVETSAATTTTGKTGEKDKKKDDHSGDVSVWRVGRDVFRHVLIRHALQKHDDIKAILLQVDLFETLSESAMSQLVDCLTPVRWKVGDRIVQKGAPGSIFYIIQEGHVQVHDIGLGDSQYNDLVLGPGEWFGERALLTGEPRAANVTAMSNVLTLAMDREMFDEIIGPLKSWMERNLRKRTLMSIPMFAQMKHSFLDGEVDHIVDLMVELCYRKGEKLTEAGKPYEENLWIIRHGEVLVSSPMDGSMHSLQTGNFWGDAFLKGSYKAKIIGDDDGQPQQKLCRHTSVCEENVTAWVLSRRDLESVLGFDLEERLGKTMDFEHKKKKHDQKILFKDLVKHTILGKGAFGMVWLVSHVPNRQETKPTTTPKQPPSTYALKAVSKHKLLESKQTHSIMREKEFLCLLKHPFITRLISTFQDENYVYLLLPLIQGGELFSVLQNSRTASSSMGLSSKHAAFYAACVIEALGHLHGRSIAYRDLKLENCMIDSDGYCRLVDLGFAKLVYDKTFTLVGTPQYLAPEILLCKGHDKAVDYWSFGVLVYEMLLGSSPFFSSRETQLEMFKRIMTVRYNKLPDTVDESARSMITALFKGDPNQRLGNLAKGFVDIKQQPWFAESGIASFRALVRKELPAPWIPEVKDPLDVSNFDDYSALAAATNHSSNSKSNSNSRKKSGGTTKNNKSEKIATRRLVQREQELFLGF